MKLFLFSCFLFCCLFVKAQQPPEDYVCPPCGACDTVVYHAPGTCPYCGMTLVRKGSSSQPGKSLNIAIYLFDGVELLDFAGPGEVFGGTSGCHVYTVGTTGRAITSQGFVQVTPNNSIADCPKPDVLIIPGGDVEAAMKDTQLLAWVKRLAVDSVHVMSVCTGAGVLSAAGLLDGKTVTTFHNYIDGLQRITPKAKVLRNTRFVDNGQIITTAGISAGIDGALHLLSKLKGPAAAQDAVKRMEYDKWVPGEGLVL